jgi:lysozyme
MMSDKLRAMLIRQEGLRLKPYRDSVGKLTIGVGRNLDDDGIEESEAYTMLDNDIVKHTIDAQKLDVFVSLDPVRQDVLIDMVFNMGLSRVQGFKMMLAALAAGNWHEAANQMLDSKWATEVGNRALELAEMIRTGAYG